MSLESTLFFLSSGFLLSKYTYKKSYSITTASLGIFSLLYGGAMLEFDNFIVCNKIPKNRPGYWIIGGGIVSAGIVLGNVCRKIKDKIN